MATFGGYNPWIKKSKVDSRDTQWKNIDTLPSGWSLDSSKPLKWRIYQGILQIIGKINTPNNNISGTIKIGNLTGCPAIPNRIFVINQCTASGQSMGAVSADLNTSTGIVELSVITLQSETVGTLFLQGSGPID